ncbi:methyltransferase domain-containing protein [Candidatus Dormiibacter inghamiae]|uniref:protein-L-isoaspartate O-methyltransferase family protein n=1 Tax=Candidatus Dormiibacter inghamiae TaxID=3127013 RepID=UPI0030C6A2EA
MESEPEGQRLNERLIASLIAAGVISQPAVAAAFRATPRHYFLPGLRLAEAYADEAVRTKTGDDGVALSSASQPAMVAIMLQQLQVEPSNSVLEVGTGTGYNAALLAHLAGPAGHVVSLDVDEDLYARAQENLARAGVRGVEVRLHDGAQGWPQRAPFDRIVVTASAADLSPQWLRQLRQGGRLVVPMALLEGGERPHLCATFVREADRLQGESLQGCGFLPLRGELVLKSDPSAEVMEGEADESLLRTISSYVLDASPAGTEAPAGCRVFWRRPNFSFCLHRGTSRHPS